MLIYSFRPCYHVGDLITEYGGPENNQEEQECCPWTASCHQSREIGRIDGPVSGECYLVLTMLLLSA